MSMSGRILNGLTSPIRLAPLVAGCLLLLLAFADSKAQSSGAGDTSTVRERHVERFTTAPRGEKDGAVLDDGTWLHWPPHMQDQFTGILNGRGSGAGDGADGNRPSGGHPLRGPERDQPGHQRHGQEP